MQKSYIFTMLLWSLIVATSFGQITINHDTVIVIPVDITQFESVGYNTVKNTSNTDKTFMWKRTIVDLTQGWTCSICDLNLCYLSFVDSAEFDLKAGEEGTMDVHISPNNIPGFAIVDLDIFEVSDTTNSVKGKYYFNINPTTSTITWINENIKFYPNPTQDYIIINDNNITKIRIVDIKGTELFISSESGQFDVSVVPIGTHLLFMYDANNQIKSLNVLSKL